MSTRIPTITYYTNDTAPQFSFTVNKSDGTGALNLTGATAKCLIRLQGNASPLFLGTNQDCVISDAVNGIVTYDLPSAFTAVGIYTGQVEITFSSGKIQRTQRFNINVEEGIPNS